MRSFIWESASKPMFVKSVWLDTEGHHRVILEPEIQNPKIQKKLMAPRQNLRRTHSERSIAAAKDYQMLQCIGLSETKMRKKVTPLAGTKLRKQAKKGGYKGNEKEVEEEFIPPPIEPERPNERISNDKNQLTERVLQWLDKSGKNCMVKDVFLEDVDDLLKKSAEYSQFKRKLTPLRRSESVHHLQLTFNDDDYVPDPYASRCKSAAIDQYNRPLLKKASSLGNRKASASHVSPPVLSLANLELDDTKSASNSTASPSASTGGGGGGVGGPSGVTQPRVTGAGNQRKNKRMLKRKDTLIENQYKHLIHKHILETTCNTQIVKRQLHIFIPKLKKQVQGGSGGDGVGGSEIVPKTEEGTIITEKESVQEQQTESCVDSVVSEV